MYVVVISIIYCLISHVSFTCLNLIIVRTTTNISENLLIKMPDVRPLESGLSDAAA